MHLTPFAHYHHLRLAQINELKEMIAELSTDLHHVVIGGDFNIAADFSAEHPAASRRFARAKYLLRLFRRSDGTS
ncbi:MAG: hypothetical protein HC902_01950 [Calothrix sp. SM1_5_4]|nr:hypothetical protein [Calothrix sp. SM1_5_4]